MLSGVLLSVDAQNTTESIVELNNDKTTDVALPANTAQTPSKVIKQVKETTQKIPFSFERKFLAPSRRVPLHCRLEICFTF